MAPLPPAPVGLKWPFWKLGGDKSVFKGCFLIDLARNLPRALGGSWEDYFHFMDEKARTEEQCLPPGPSDGGLSCLVMDTEGSKLGCLDTLALHLALVLAFLLGCVSLWHTASGPF